MSISLMKKAENVAKIYGVWQHFLSSKLAGCSSLKKSKLSWFSWFFPDFFYAIFIKFNYKKWKKWHIIHQGINQENQENWLLLKGEHPVIFEDRKYCLKIGVCIYRGRGGGVVNFKRSWIKHFWHFFLFS